MPLTRANCPVVMAAASILGNAVVPLAGACRGIGHAKVEDGFAHRSGSAALIALLFKRITLVGQPKQVAHERGQPDSKINHAQIPE